MLAFALSDVHVALVKYIWHMVSRNDSLLVVSYVEQCGCRLDRVTRVSKHMN